MGEGGGGSELDEKKRVQTTLLDRIYNIYIYVCVFDHSI